MEILIKCIDTKVLYEIDDLFESNGCDSWRYHPAIKNENNGTCDITLNDAYINILDGKVFIIMNHIGVWLFNQCYGQIVIC